MASDLQLAAEYAARAAEQQADTSGGDSPKVSALGALAGARQAQVSLPLPERCLSRPWAGSAPEPPPGLREGVRLLTSRLSPSSFPSDSCP